ncbi:AEC family transporter [Thiohalorhabdus sp. Cl-TMA]|uniref:AEC family transporter n=1 Tax=Thiohalorhabdus methylotrophus TaxID=3242694 RepID=A0ABV4TXE8_9GAMM
MIQTMGQMAALVAIGVFWRVLQPGGLHADLMRHAVANLVYYLLLPALILSVLWEAPLGMESVGIAASALAGVLGMLAVTVLAVRLLGLPGATGGALILAGSWPNATYLGLPILAATFGEWARRVAIQFDLFACFPLLLTLGILIARHYGNREASEGALRGLLRVPPLWAALLAILLNAGGVQPPPLLMNLLADMGESVPALMLLALGMSLTWTGSPTRGLSLPLLVLVLQLGAQPLLVLGAASGLGLEGGILQAVVIEGAMPSMLLGVVLCDRYGLDTPLYAKAVTLSTAVSLLTTPLWFLILQ